MQVRVLFFGVLRELMGGGERALEVRDGATAGDVVAACRAMVKGDDSGLWGALAVAVNQEYAGRGQVLSEGDVVALLPPVSGGADVTGSQGWT